MPLINNWNDTGGVGEVLFWNGLSTHEDFFTDPGARRTYRNTVKALLTCAPALLPVDVCAIVCCWGACRTQRMMHRSVQAARMHAVVQPQDRQPGTDIQLRRRHGRICDHALSCDHRA